MEGNFFVEEDIDSLWEIKIFVKEPAEINELNKYRPSKNDDINSAREKIRKIREKKKKINKDNIVNIVKKFNQINQELKYEISEYSSVIKIKVEDMLKKDKIYNDLEKISKFKDVEKIYCRNHISNNSIEMDEVIPAINADSMFTSREYTGNGINLGIIEAGSLPRETIFHEDFSNREFIYFPGDTISTDFYDVNHADAVTMIAAGNNGIANGVKIFSAATDDPEEVFGRIEWMIDNGVDIINGSYGNEKNAIYTEDAKELDYIISNYFVPFVSSSGNTGLFISNPATSYNCITVGANEDSSGGYIKSDYSSYAEGVGYGASKPNVMAPGNLSTNAFGGVAYRGTSFAAPQVTGCIALLMEEFPYLIGYPELITSIVTSSASPMSSTYNNDDSIENKYDASGLHNQIGSGLLNYEKMREAAETCLDIFVPSNSSPEEVVDYIEFDANANQRIRASLSWLANGTDTNNFTNYDLYLHKKNGSTYKLMKYIDGTTNNVEFLDFDVQLSGTYRLSVKQNETNITGDYLGLSYVLIDDSIGGSTSGGKYGHVYEYTSISNTKHRGTCLCGCGDIIEESHTFRITGIGTPSICIYCGKTSGGGIPGIFPLNNNKEYVTENGSFKLFNGVTYLVEQDIEAYLNGSLIFIPFNSSII